MTGTYRIVIHEAKEAYLACGWIFRANLGPWSCLMLACACNPEGYAP